MDSPELDMERTPDDDNSSSAEVHSSVTTWISAVVEEVRKGRFPARLQRWDDIGSEFDSSSHEKSEKNNTGQLHTFQNLSNFSRTKLSGLFSKIKTNRANLTPLQNINMEDKLNKSNKNLSFQIAEPEKQLLPPNQSSYEEQQNMFLKSRETSSCLSSSGFHSTDNNLNISNVSTDDGFSLFSRQLKLADIGRSSTYFDDECRQFVNTMAPIGEIQSSPKNKILRDMRSLSVHIRNDESVADSYKLNDRSHSSTYLNDNGCIDNQNNNGININKKCEKVVSSSLPNFMPISPVLKSAASKDTSLSESSRRKSVLFRDSSIQSDSSHCSSVDSLLESRKPDPEAILVNLGFGPIQSEDILTRIPKRFLKPSQVRGIDTEAFLRRQQLASQLHDHSVLGYRGLLGNPDIPPSNIVAKIMERFEENERNRSILDINMNRPQSAPPTPSTDDNI